MGISLSRLGPSWNDWGRDAAKLSPSYGKGNVYDTHCHHEQRCHAMPTKRKGRCNRAWPLRHTGQKIFHCVHGQADGDPTVITEQTYPRDASDRTSKDEPSHFTNPFPFPCNSLVVFSRHKPTTFKDQREPCYIPTNFAPKKGSERYHYHQSTTTEIVHKL